MKNELNLSFLKTKKLLYHSNSDKVKIQRQQFAMELVRLIEQEKRIINIDETWINESNFTRKVWGRKDGRGNARFCSITPRISMIAALDFNGKVWYSLSHATTDSDVIALFWK